MAEKVVLAYSGGLDTSVAIRWLQENYGMDVVTLTADLGHEMKGSKIKDRALKTGAVKAYVEDAKELFVRHFAFPALQANALYEGVYPLATALGRPLIAWLLVKTARKEGATAVAHGCTGKGNDQVRFDVSVQALAPELKVIAPAREWEMTDRNVEIAYAKKHGIPVPVTEAQPYSTDENLWGRSIEGGLLEDPGNEPREEVYTWTKPVQDAPAEPAYVEIGFEKGVPGALNGEQLDGVSLIKKLNALAGRHGVGRIDHIENRLVGIKSREVYEAPAAVVLLQAHQALGSHEPGQRPAPVQGEGRPGVRRPDLQRPVVHGPAPGPCRLCAEHPAPCHGDGTGPAAQGLLRSRRQGIARLSLQARTLHLR